MSVIRKIPWTTQPPQGTPINFGNPLTRNLVFAVSGGYEATTGEQGKIVGSGRLAQTSRGVAFRNTANATDGMGFTGEVLNRISSTFDSSTDAITNRAIMYPTAQPSNFKGLVWMIGTAPTTWGSPYTAFGYQDFDASSTAWDYGFAGSTSTQARETRNTTSVTSPLNRWVVMSQSMDTVDGPATHLHYINGVSQSVSTFSPNTFSFANVGNGAPLSIFCRNINDPGEGYEGFHVASFLWNRALTHAEHLALYYNPWQMFEPRTQIIGVTTAAPAPSTFRGLTLLGVGS